MNNTADNPFLRSEKRGKRNYLYLFITFFAVFITIIAILIFLVFTPNEVNGTSMNPNFQDGEFLLVSKPHSWLYGTGLADTLGMNYKRGDVVIFTLPGEGDIVKRVMAVPGDTIRIENGYFYLNGERFVEPFEILNNQRKDGDFLVEGEPAITVPPDHFFLAGDNRDVSYDSRAVGPIPIEDIKGRVILQVFPFKGIPTYSY